jgi:uncharacterized protein
MNRIKFIVIKILRITLGTMLSCLILLTSCQSKLLYFPRAYEAGRVSEWVTKYRGEKIQYETSQGPQVGYLQRRVHQAGPPERLWIVGGGNGSLALDLAEYCWEHGDSRDAFLLVDYPGYGDCAGAPTPSRIRENMAGVVPATAKALGVDLEVLRPRLRVFGHSLGTACVLLAAQEYGIRQGVLLAPFTSTMEMTKVVLHVPLGWLVWHRLDNEARLQELAVGGGKFIVFHGTADEVIPVRMSRELKAAAPGLVDLHEVPGAHHNDLLQLQAGEIQVALSLAR